MNREEAIRTAVSYCEDADRQYKAGDHVRARTAAVIGQAYAALAAVLPKPDLGHIGQDPKRKLV